MGHPDQSHAPARSVQVVQEITVYRSFTSEIFLDASYTYEHCLLQLFGRPKKVYKQNTVKLVVDFQKLA